MTLIKVERDAGEQALGIIGKTHEKIRNEARGMASLFSTTSCHISTSTVSLYFKQKLRTQYVNALEDAKKELV